MRSGFITSKAAGRVNPKDIEFFAEAKRRKFKHARLAAFGSTRRKGVAGRERRPGAAAARSRHAGGHDLRQDLAAARQGSPAHHAGREPGDDRRHRALPQGPRQVRHLRRRARFDGYKDDPEYALATWQAAEKAGADFVVLCDTNGGCLPGEVAAITAGRARQAERARSASTRTTTSAWAWPTRWPRSRPARRTCRAPSMATASAPATATSPA